MEQVVFGGRMNIPKGTTFFKTGENVEHVYLLVNGQVRARSEYMKMNLDNGALLGILDIYSEEYLVDYASDDTRNVGQKLIEQELEKIPNEKVRTIAKEHIFDIRNNNKRDFRFDGGRNGNE